ncbi:hypothetical protein QZH41_003808 [Actinostola sp. cb2023]|nr:hypothetical protein QZH41_003808 [Actinostola sp. cb2023]
MCFLVSLEFFDTLTGIASILTLSAISVERFYAIYFPFKHRMVRFKIYVAFMAFPWIEAVIVAVLSILSYFYKNQHLYNAYTYHAFLVASVALVVISASYISIGMKIRQNNPSAQNQNRALLLQFCNSGINVFIYIIRMSEFRTAFLAIIYNRKDGIDDSQDSTKSEATSSVSTNASYMREGNQRKSGVQKNENNTYARGNTGPTLNSRLTKDKYILHNRSNLASTEYGKIQEAKSKANNIQESAKTSENKGAKAGVEIKALNDLAREHRTCYNGVTNAGFTKDIVDTKL